MSEALKKQNIPVSEIGSTLESIWRDLDEQETIKACLFNLLIYEESSEPHTFLHSTLEEVVSKYPCRVISIYEDKKSKKKEIVANVSADLVGDGSNAVAHDHIEITMPSSLRMQAPFLVLPHILTDLPVYMLWAQNPANDNDVFPYMREIADHIIFDSTCVHNVGNYAEYILKQNKVYKGGVSDLNWAVLDSWRDIIRKCLNSQERLDHLAEAKSIRIHYKSTDSTVYNETLPALYLQAWIASCFNWAFVSTDTYEGNTHVTYKHLKGEVSCTITPDKELDFPGGTISCVASTDYDQNTILFKQDKKKPFITFHHSSQQKCDFPANHHFDPAQSHQSLVKRVLQNFTSLHYIKTLKKLAEMDTE